MSLPQLLLQIYPRKAILKRAEMQARIQLSYYLIEIGDWRLGRKKRVGFHYLDLCGRCLRFVKGSKREKQQTKRGVFLCFPFF